MNERRMAALSAGIIITLMFISPVSAFTPPAHEYELTAIEGELQTFSGDAFAGEPAYLAFTGEGFSPLGVRLDAPSETVVNGDPDSFTRGEMTAENKWVYDWDTEAAGLGPGIYTVYILQDPVDLDHLDGHCYFVVDLTVVPEAKQQSPLSASTALLGVAICVLAVALNRR